MLETVKAASTILPSKTITIRPSLPSMNKNQQQQQQIIVIPQNMLVNGCISAKSLKAIIDEKNSQGCIKTAENRPSLKRPSPSSDYGSDSEMSETHGADKPVRKRANLDHLSPEEKLMRRKLKNRVAAQNARDKKRVKMEEMEIELKRIKAHAKALEQKNAKLVSENERLSAENIDLRQSRTVLRGQESGEALVEKINLSSSPAEANGGQQYPTGCVLAGVSTESKALTMASRLLLILMNKANRRHMMKLPIKKRVSKWPT